jgi:hypothetical protein
METRKKPEPQAPAAADDFAPNQKTNKEKQEGARETYAMDQDEMAYAERRDLAQEDLEKQQQQESGAGITNRPLDLEKKEQEALPPRGARKSGAS